MLFAVMVVVDVDVGGGGGGGGGRAGCRHTADAVFEVGESMRPVATEGCHNNDHNAKTQYQEHNPTNFSPRSLSFWILDFFQPRVRRISHSSHLFKSRAVPLT